MEREWKKPDRSSRAEGRCRCRKGFRGPGARRQPVCQAEPQSGSGLRASSEGGQGMRKRGEHSRGVGATLRHIVMGFRSQGSRGKNESFVAGWWIEVYRWPTIEWSSGWYQNLSPTISDSTRQRNHSFKVLRGNNLKIPLCTRLSDIFKELPILLILHRHPIRLSYLRTYYNKTWMKNKCHGIQKFKNQTREVFELSLSADLESS